RWSQPGIEALAGAAVDLVGDRRRVVLGIAGAPGAGKSTLAEALLEAVSRATGREWVAHVPMDGFHLADVQLDRLRNPRPKSAPHPLPPARFARPPAGVAPA